MKPSQEQETAPCFKASDVLAKKNELNAVICGYILNSLTVINGLLQIELT
jgi:hypothetical protein